MGRLTRRVSNEVRTSRCGPHSLSEGVFLRAEAPHQDRIVKQETERPLVAAAIGSPQCNRLSKTGYGDTRPLLGTRPALSAAEIAFFRAEPEGSLMSGLGLEENKATVGGSFKHFWSRTRNILNSLTRKLKLEVIPLKKESMLHA
jgi:hypothetical protein